MRQEGQRPSPAISHGADFTYGLQFLYHGSDIRNRPVIADLGTKVPADLQVFRGIPQIHAAFGAVVKRRCNRQVAIRRITIRDFLYVRIGTKDFLNYANPAFGRATGSAFRRRIRARRQPLINHFPITGTLKMFL